MDVDQYECSDCGGALIPVGTGVWGKCLSCGNEDQIHCCDDCMNGV